MRSSGLLGSRLRFVMFGACATISAACAQAQPTATAGAAPQAGAKPGAKPRAAGVKGTAHLRVLHAIVGGPSVDVYVDGKKALEGVSYKGLSPYLDVPSGSHVLALRLAGSEAASAPIATLKRSLAAEGYFVAAAATVGSKPVILVQNETTGKGSEKRASVRFYHLSPDAGPVSISAPSASRMAKNGTRSVVKELLPGKSRSASLPSGSTTLSLSAGGKVLKQVPVAVEAGHRYAAFAVGKAGGTGDEALEVIVKPVAK